MWPSLILLLTVASFSLAEQTRSNLFIKTGGEGKSLPYLRRKLVYTQGEIECARECVQDSTCSSFNIGPLEDTNTTKCELNFDTNRDSGIELADKADWSYYEGQNAPISSGGVTAAAYDPLHKWWFMVFGNTLFQFPELETGTMVFEGQTNLQGYDIQGMLVLNSTANDTIDLRFYLGDGTVANGILDVNGTFSLTITPPSLDATDLHGPEIQGGIRDVLNFNDTMYIFAGNQTYVLDPEHEGVVIEQFWSYDPVPHNPFYAMPREVTAATQLAHPRLMFFKDSRIYWFDGELQRVTGGALLTTS